MLILKLPATLAACKTFAKVIPSTMLPLNHLCSSCFRPSKSKTKIASESDKLATALKYSYFFFNSVRKKTNNKITIIIIAAKI